jgi:hypothetical protein
MAHFLGVRRNWVVNGNGETGTCAVASEVSSPRNWNYSGPITQIYYNNTDSAILTDDAGPR